MNRRYLWDLLERTGATYLQAFLGLLLAGEWDVGNLGEVVTLGRAALFAAIPAALAVLKAGIARLTGDKNDASLVQ